MGVPNTASLANLPGSTPGVGVLPQGLYLAGDIRQSMDSDTSFYDIDPTRGSSGGEFPPSYQPETRLSRLAGYNGITPDRGVLTPGTNHFPNRTSTAQVKMGDFANFTTTTFVSSSDTLFENTSNMNFRSSSNYFDFVGSPEPWRAFLNPKNYGTLYNLAYIDNNDDPRLATVLISGSYNNPSSGNFITQTGSNFQWETYTKDFQPLNPPATNADIVCVDQGMWDSGVTSLLATTSENARMGCFYWQSGTNAKIMAYTISGSENANTLIYHDDSTAVPSNQYGVKIAKALNPASSIPPLQSTDDFPASSILVYWGINSLRARLFTISGSKFQDSNDINIYSGSEYVITTNINTAKGDKGYIAVCNDSSGLQSILYGENYNTSQEGDDLVKYVRIYPTNLTISTTHSNFLANPTSFLGLQQFGQIATLWSSGTYKYGAKAICPSTAGGNPNKGFITVVAKSNGKIDAKYIGESGLVTGSLIDEVGVDRFGNGEVIWQNSIGVAPLGEYREYSSSLVEDPNSYDGSRVGYYAISYTVEASSGYHYPRTSVIKVYHETGAMYYNTDREKVDNYESNYEVYPLWHIANLPQVYTVGGRAGYDVLHSSDYPNGTYRKRPDQFLIPMVMHRSWSSSTRMGRTFLTLY